MSAEEVRGGRRIRVIDLETSGPSTHNVCEIGWQDVIQGDDGHWSVDDERGAVFVNPGAPISTETMAVHHIIDADVAGAPFWKDAAPPILQPTGGAVALAAHRATFEQRFCTPRLSGGARWICTWKCALRTWPDLPSFSNQRLRYELMPVGLDRTIGLPAHRALPDAYVTAHHLRDMLNAASLEQLLVWSEQPGLLPRVPAGPYRRRPWSDLSNESLAGYVRDRDVDVRYSAGNELRRRGVDDGVAAQDPVQRPLL
ncbi:exonuclease domain-containing protein [Sphingomonas sp. BAUL-RG-20F-R05-02]|uniref:exonuclease domain-containing protein n=1 Tax=Sphingomonas sp. BAUL-RG-20F-R05-02 TaxID=2914830 RepID=UPI001F57403C|nr:exonuclease domain-containing protein [Sphingomonas sp. BAUL-RG-20F-R05-02]